MNMLARDLKISKFHLLVRKVILSILRLTAIDIRIRHPYTRRSFMLNLYKHKGYWYYGKKRELNSMKRFNELIKPGMTILEVGGHIGYITTFFSILTGNAGKVIVFEPGSNNLRYLYKNIELCKRSNIVVEELAAGDKSCEMEFYLDPLTGQNNTLVKDFEGFNRNRSLSAQPNAEYRSENVKVIRLDDYFDNTDLPDFVKIDIEGYEWECITGLKTSVEKNRPVLMIEMQANEEYIFEYFISVNYKIYNDMKEEIISFKDFADKRTPNIFFLPS